MATPDGNAWQVARVQAIAQETPLSRTITFQLPGPAEHLAGQHYELRLTSSTGYQAARPYSAASAADADGLLDITIANVPRGEVSPYLDGLLAVGDQVEIRGPFGNFFVWTPKLTQPVLLVAGGSGVAPMRSILQAHRAARSKSPMQLLYSTRSYDEIPYKSELLDMPNVLVTLTGNDVPDDWDGATGRIDAELVSQALAHMAADVMCYVCGMTRFVEAAADLLIACGVPAARIKTERFGA